MTQGILGNDTSYDSPLVLICQLTDLSHVKFPPKNEGRKEGSFRSLHSEVSVTSATKAGQQKSFVKIFFLHCFLAALNVCSLG